MKSIIVEKPQYNTEELKVGDLIVIKTSDYSLNRKMNSNQFAALVNCINKLELQATIITTDGHIEHVRVTIDEIIAEKYTVTKVSYRELLKAISINVEEEGPFS